MPYAADWAYLQYLLGQADIQKLAQQREWHILLHYQPSRGGYVSEVDDPKFFNAFNGKTNPQAELEATLKALFAAPTTQQHPQCAFIARYYWLKQQLNFDPVRLPPQSCPDFEQWFAQLQPAGLSLIFPAAYLNNPSSMFGHTLLRIDQANQNEQTRLLAYALNYAAATEEENGLVFAFKGTMGGYPGVFSILPYYKKVKEYSDLEHRDVWEYQLNFSQAEVYRLLRHVWELDDIYFEYYFFDENCAYHLLSLLEVARHTLHLRDKLPPWVIPADTVRAVIAVPGILKKAIFRPASTTHLHHRLHQFSPKQQDLVYKLATREIEHTDLSALDLTTRTKVLEVAYDYLYYQYKGKQANKMGAQHLRKLLIARSHLPSNIAFSALPVPLPPEQGHTSFRLTMGLGYDGEEHYQSLQLRPAYHDLLDPEASYTPGAQINFLDLSLRHQNLKLKLEGLKLIDIMSLTPRDRFFQPLSWKINTGWLRRQLNKGKRSLVYRTNGGVGFSYKWLDNVLGYSFLESSLDIGGKLQHDYALGVGGRLGLFVDVGSRWRGHIYTMVQRFSLGHTQTVREMGIEQRFTLSQNSSLRLQWGYHYFNHNQATSQVELSWQWYLW